MQRLFARRPMAVAALLSLAAGIVAFAPVVASPASAASSQTVTVASDATWTVDGSAPSVLIAPNCSGDPWGWFNNPDYLPGQPMWDRTCPITGNFVGEHHLFSKTFTVPGVVQSAHLNYSIDNEGSASINGQQAGSIVNWWQPVNSDVTALVQTGSNTITIDATDLGGIAATVLRLTVTYTSANVVKTKDDCKNGGWANVTRPDGSSFKNQGDCVSYVASAGRSDSH